ncbi:MAG: NAD-glutamate dehydrogenase [Candidatus Omnitrophica bacterium]|nr:NAD-glutamate dehydrogenase [Candidatus Omnitrophota bacterium]
MQVAWAGLFGKKRVVWVGVAAFSLAVIVGAGWWNGFRSDLLRRKAALQKEWERSRAVLSRADELERRGNELRVRYPALFSAPKEATAVMAELDALAREAGIAVDMLRPVPAEAPGGVRCELSMRGTWAGLMQFLREAEGPARLFTFSLLRIQRQEPTGELLVTAEAQKSQL